MPGTETLDQYLARGGTVRVCPPHKKTPKARDWSEGVVIRLARRQAKRDALRIMHYHALRAAGVPALEAWNTVREGVQHDRTSHT